MDVAGRVFELFILILLGYAGRKFKVFDEKAVDSLSALVMKIALPCMIFVSFQQPFSRELLGEAGTALGLSLLIYFISIVICFIYPIPLGLKGAVRGVHRFVIVFSNVGYMGYPLVQAIMGDSWLFHLSMFNVPFNLLCFSLGAWLIAREGEKSLNISWRIFLNPPVVSTVLGFAFFLGSIRFPVFLRRSLSMAGNITSPGSMLIVGIVLAGMDVRRILGRWQNYVTSLVRLIVMPLLIGVILYALGVRNPLLMLCTLVMATPAAASVTVMASIYGGDIEEASALTSLSTCMSLITIPVIVYLVNLTAG